MRCGTAGCRLAPVLPASFFEVGFSGDFCGSGAVFWGAAAGFCCGAALVFGAFLSAAGVLVSASFNG